MVGSSRQPASRLRSAAYSVLHSAMVAGILRQQRAGQDRLASAQEHCSTAWSSRAAKLACSEVRRHRQQEQHHPQQRLSGSLGCAVQHTAMQRCHQQRWPPQAAAGWERCRSCSITARPAPQSDTTLELHKPPDCRSLRELCEHELLGQLVSRLLVLDHVLHSGMEAAKQVRKGCRSASFAAQGCRWPLAQQRAAKACMPGGQPQRSGQRAAWPAAAHAASAAA